MASSPKRTILTRLDAAQTCIKNTIADPQLATMLAQYGYDEARLQAGQTLYNEALSAVNAQSAAAGTQRRATIQTAQAEAQARAAYQSLATVARAIFERTSPERKALELVGTTPQSTVEFLTIATTLFDNALRIPEIQAALREYGYDEARITQDRQTLAALEQARQTQVAAMGASVEATRTQTIALAALESWVKRFRAIARTALQGNPQLAERIGIAVRTAPTTAQRNAAKQAAATRAALQAT